MKAVFLRFRSNSHNFVRFQRKATLCTWKLYKQSIERGNKLLAWHAVSKHLIHLYQYQIKTVLVFNCIGILLFLARLLLCVYNIINSTTHLTDPQWFRMNESPTIQDKTTRLQQHLLLLIISFFNLNFSGPKSLEEAQI